MRWHNCCSHLGSIIDNAFAVVLLSRVEWGKLNVLESRVLMMAVANKLREYLRIPAVRYTTRCFTAAFQSCLEVPRCILFLMVRVTYCQSRRCVNKNAGYNQYLTSKCKEYRRNGDAVRYHYRSSKCVRLIVFLTVMCVTSN